MTSRLLSEPKIPPYLRIVMEDFMSKGVKGLCLHENGDVEKTRKIFTEHVFSPHFNKDLLSTMDLGQEPLLKNEIEFLHRLFNNPEDARVFDLKPNDGVLESLRSEMLKSLTKIVETLGSHKKVEETKPVASRPLRLLDRRRFLRPEAPSQERQEEVSLYRKRGKRGNDEWCCCWPPDPNYVSDSYNGKEYWSREFDRQRARANECV